MHADGVYIWQQTAWEKTDTHHPTTHRMKVGRGRRMGDVSGIFFFAIPGREIARNWEDLPSELILQRGGATASWGDAVSRWEEWGRL